MDQQLEGTTSTTIVKKRRKEKKKKERHLKKLKNRKVFHTHILEEYLKIMKEGA